MLVSKLKKIISEIMNARSDIASPQYFIKFTFSLLIKRRRKLPTKGTKSKKDIKLLFSIYKLKIIQNKAMAIPTIIMTA